MELKGSRTGKFEVFQLFGERGTEEVAEALNLSPKTVEVHRANIRTRLGLKNGGAVVRYAVSWMESQKLGISF